METTREVTLTLEKQTYNYQKSPEKWTVTLRKSDVQVPEEKDLAILNVTHSLLLNGTIDWQEDTVGFAYEIPRESRSFEELKKASKQSKLRAMMNMAAVEELLQLPLTFFIHPENLVFDYNLLPKIAYRGLAGKMPPTLTNEEIMLRQYKCLIIDLFEKGHSFTNLYEGQLEIKRGSEFVQTIIKQESFASIQEYLLNMYNQTVEKDQQSMKKVSKSRFQVMKQLSIWMSILSIVLAIPLVYLLFFQLPFTERMQNTDTAFLKNDYEAVITELEPVKTKSIPFTQKYELSYSFVQGKDLNDQQKKVILNNITLRSDEQYLDYWIENGRGNLDEALDIAKKLEEPDLILYGITQKIEQVRNNAKLSGTEKESQINTLEGDYKKYDEKREELLNNGQVQTEEQAQTQSTDTQEAE